MKLICRRNFDTNGVKKRRKNVIPQIYLFRNPYHQIKHFQDHVFLMVVFSEWIVNSRFFYMGFSPMRWGISKTTFFWGLCFQRGLSIRVFFLTFFDSLCFRMRACFEDGNGTSHFMVGCGSFIYSIKHVILFFFTWRYLEAHILVCRVMAG